MTSNRWIGVAAAAAVLSGSAGVAGQAPAPKKVQTATFALG